MRSRQRIEADHARSLRPHHHRLSGCLVAARRPRPGLSTTPSVLVRSGATTRGSGSRCWRFLISCCNPPRHFGAACISRRTTRNAPQSVPRRRSTSTCGSHISGRTTGCASCRSAGVRPLRVHQPRVGCAAGAEGVRCHAQIKAPRAHRRARGASSLGGANS